MVTGSPDMARKMPSKSSRWKGSSLARCCLRSSSVSAMIMARTCGSRSCCMNMCSVRHSPMPWAPNSRACLASSGVSALVRTPRRRTSSAQARTVFTFSSMAAGDSAAWPKITLPLAPSMEIQSPSLTTTSPTVNLRASTSTFRSWAPAMQGLPIPRATTAAWEVMPPWLVMTPWALISPWISSGLVSQRTRMTLSPREPFSSASFASKTTWPTAAPGDAPRPVARTV